ncbi:Zinc finger, HIT-type [Dillenia turbinata]|uniref:Zinc finger, HIT-type n=1 Tax=Dillenia turbinata TaxID=194707 RepID=A0AAN8YX93_9MAGN
MEGFGGSFSLSDLGSSVRKRRSNTLRRPRGDAPIFPENQDMSSLSSTPPYNLTKGSGEEINGYSSSSRRKDGLNQCNSLASSVNTAEPETCHENSMNEYGPYQDRNDRREMLSTSKRFSEGVLAPANWKSKSKMKDESELQSRTKYDQIGGKIWKKSGVESDARSHDNHFKKVKLRVGSVTCTIHAKTTSDITSVGQSSTKSNGSLDSVWSHQKLLSQDDSVDHESASQEMGDNLHGVSWIDSKSGYALAETDKHEAVRKSKRVPKKRIFNDAFNDKDDDQELRYLEKLKTSRASAGYGRHKDDEVEKCKKQQKTSRVLKDLDVLYNLDVREHNSSRADGNGKKSRSGRVSDDADYVEEDEPVSDCEPETRKKKPKREFIHSLGDVKNEMAVTTRQRALQAGKDISSISSSSLVEFPNGLPPAPPRKQKEKPSEVEQQLKKAEAAQRRRMQMEKAAWDSQTEAIRKILGQDSSRKKREEKMKQRQKQLVQEKAAKAMVLAPDNVRWFMGPSGTIVTFPSEMGLPSIFDQKPCSYPPPREKCAGPSCMNPYKYRDSKSKLPLCSLQCYKAIHEKMKPLHVES